jgi:hypothetical protein
MLRLVISVAYPPQIGARCVPQKTQFISDCFNTRCHEIWGRGPQSPLRGALADNVADLDLNAMELARLAPDAIFVTGSPSLRAMRRASVNIPIVFGSVADPVEQGFVSSLAHPGANITGFAVVEFGFAPKQLDLLKKLAPNLERITYLYDPANPVWAGDWAEVCRTVVSAGSLEGTGTRR